MRRNDSAQEVGFTSKRVLNAQTVEVVVFGISI